MTMRSPELDMQLSAMAAATDRANRPHSLLVIPLLLVVAATIVLLWSASRVSAAKAAVITQKSNLSRIEQLVDAIKSETQATVDLEKLFPRQAYFSSNVTESWRDRGVNFSQPPAVSDPVSSRILSGPHGVVSRSEVTCSLTSEPLEEILKWIDNVLRHPSLQGQVWVSHLQLSPSGRGWRATIRFALYEARK